MGADVAAVEQFGPYLVYERLGVGGMATVHRALERGIEGFERIVALKRLLPHLAADATFIKSFIREAKLASALSHINIVQIFQLGRVGSQYFISMEYIDGRDIRRILRHARKVSGPPPIHVTVGLLLQLCDALDYAHHKLDDAGRPMGLVHRDVSPSNVLVTSNGQVKVIDFGIAKAQSSQLRTQTGKVKGKLAYMAPEALAGKQLDARSDLFAAGIIAHELLTARPLFAARNEYQTLMKVQHGEVAPPSTFNQSCPRALDAIVMRALARNPDERYRHAGELRDQLQALRKQHNLATADRDIAIWLDWVLRLEAPGGFAASTAELGPGDADSQRSSRTSRPRRTDDDDVVDLVWGGYEEHSAGDAVLLDDVPDVSARPVEPGALGAGVQLEFDDLGGDDDIPTPIPSHGRPTVDIAPRTVTTPMRPRHQRQKLPAMGPPRGSEPIAAQSAGPRAVAAEVPAGTPPAPVRAASVDDEVTTSDLPEIAAQPVVVPSRARTISLPPRALPSSSVPPRSIAAAALPPRTVPAAGEPSRAVPLPLAPARGGAAALESRAVPAVIGPAAVEPSRAVPLPRSAIAPAALPRTSTLPMPSFAAPAAAQAPIAPRSMPAASTPPRERRAHSPSSPGTPPRAAIPLLLGRDTARDLVPTEIVPALALDKLCHAPDTAPSIPALSVSDALSDALSDARLRFHEAAPSPADTLRDMTAAATAHALSELADDASAAAPTRPQRLVTPATELFAEPESDSEGDAFHTTRDEPAAHSTIREGRRPLWRRLPLGLIALFAGVSAVTAAAALYLTRQPSPHAALPPTAPGAPSRLGTVRLEVVPVDAAIAISGVPVHTGSPWTIDLAPGTYQIEIARDGYLRWLTSIELAAGQSQVLRVALERHGSAQPAGATLVVGSTPGGLEIIVDGTSVARTPGKATIAAGRHRITLRGGGVELWKTDVDARASAVYEFHPTVAVPPAPGAPAGSAGPGQPAAPATR